MEHRLQMIKGCFVFFLYFVICVKAKSPTEDILIDYDKAVRPAQGPSESVRVVFKLHLSELIDVSEVSQKIETRLWLYHRWKDVRLTWDPEEYDNKTAVHLTADNIWLPIFVLYNNADGDFAILDKRSAKVHYNGTVEWFPPVIYRSICEIEVADFPFDIQNCKMKIGPWTRGINQLDMVNSDGRVTDNKCEPPVIDNYNSNGEWRLLHTECDVHYVNYTCCIDPYVDMTYTIHIQRRPLYLLMAILFPTMLFSLLTSVVFYMPSGSAEKITLSISLLLTLVVFLLVIVDAMPSTAKGVPLLGKYLLFTMTLVTLSIIISVFVLNIHYRTPSTHTMPFWVKKLFMVTLPRRMFSSTIRRIDPDTIKKTEDERKRFYAEISDISGRQDEVTEPLLLNPDCRRAIRGVTRVANRYRRRFQCYKEGMEWTYVAMVMDHFLLYIFLVTCLLGTILIFGKRVVEMQMPYTPGSPTNKSDH